MFNRCEFPVHRCHVAVGVFERNEVFAPPLFNQFLRRFHFNGTHFGVLPYQFEATLDYRTDAREAAAGDQCPGVGGQKTGEWLSLLNLFPVHEMGTTLVLSF